MIKRCRFKIAMGDNASEVAKTNLKKLFDGVDIEQFKFCVFEKEKMKNTFDFSIVAYFFMNEQEANDFLFFSGLLFEKRLFLQKSKYIFSSIISRL